MFLSLIKAMKARISRTKATGNDRMIAKPDRIGRRCGKTKRAMSVNSQSRIAVRFTFVRTDTGSYEVANRSNKLFNPRREFRPLACNQAACVTRAPPGMEAHVQPREFLRFVWMDRYARGAERLALKHSPHKTGLPDDGLNGTESVLPH